MYSIDELYSDIKGEQDIYKVYKKYGGMSIYIPKIAPDHKERIIEEFDGYNQSSLAGKYNVSYNTVIKIIRESQGKRKTNKSKDEIINDLKEVNKELSKEIERLKAGTKRQKPYTDLRDKNEQVKD